MLSGSGAIQLANVTDGANNFTLQVQDNNAGSTGAVTINGALTVNALVTGTAAFDLSLLDGATLAADMDFTNDGAVVLGDASTDVFDFNGGLETRNGPNSLNLAGTIRTDSRAMDLIDATLGANTTLASGSAVISTGAITDGASVFTLSLQEDTAGSTGTVSIAGALDVDDLITFGQAYSVELNGATTAVTQAFDFLNTGTVTLGNGGDSLTFSGGLTTAGNASNPATPS